MRNLLILMVAAMTLTGCKFYGSALPPDYPLSMDDSLDVARSATSGPDGISRPVIRHETRPRIDRPTYLPEKELAVVAPPKTLLLWTYPYIDDDNTRTFGNWSTIFLTDRYEWVPPSNAVPAKEMTLDGWQ